MISLFENFLFNIINVIHIGGRNITYFHGSKEYYLVGTNIRNYVVLSTQVQVHLLSASFSGIASLTGYLKSLVRSVWSELEIVDDQSAYKPKSWPVSPIEKNTVKVGHALYIMFVSFYK